MSERKQKKAAYDIEYAKKNIVRKFIPFNRTSDLDMKLLEWIGKHGNATKYIKDLIQKDMEAETK